jgi:autotransporter-associated beta strand protein
VTRLPKRVRHRPRAPIPLSSVAAFCGALLVGTSGAAIYYWDADLTAGDNLLSGQGLGGTGSWDASMLNWWNGLPTDLAWPNTNADTAIFTGAPGIVTLTAPINANALRFDASGYNLAAGANALTLGGVLSSIAVTNSGDLATINTAITLTSNTLFGGAGDLKLNGLIGGATFGFTKTGAGSVTVSGANTFTGPVILSSGTLAATTSNTALGGAGSTLALRGGELKLANNTGLAMANTTTITGSTQITTDTLGATTGVSHSLGTLSMGEQTLTVSGGSTVTSGTQGLTFGATTLTGNATFSVNNSTAAGSTSTTLLTLGAVANSSFTATITGNGSVAQTGVWGNGAGGITYSGAGTLTLNQANTFTGALTVTSGTVAGTASPGALGAGRLVLQGGNLVLTSTLGTGLTFSRPTFVTGPATITSDVPVNGFGRPYTLGTLEIGAQTLTIKPGSHITQAGDAEIAFGATALTGDATFDVQTPPGAPGSTLLRLGGLSDLGAARTIVFQSSQTGPESGMVVLGGQSSFTEGTSVLLAGLGNGVNVTLGTVTTGLGSSTRVTVTAPSTLTFGFAGQIYQLGSLAGNGTVTTTTTVMLGLGNSGTAPDADFSGVLSNGTGAITLSKLGKGTVTLSGAQSNSTSGVTAVSTGTLVLSKADPVGGTNPVALTGTGLTIGVTAIIGLGKATVRMTQSEQIPSSSTLKMNAGSTLILDPGVKQTVDGTVTLILGNTISGGGTLALSPASSTIDVSGVSTMSANLQLTTATAAVRTLLLTGSFDSLAISGNITEGATAGGLTKDGSGTLTLSGNNSYTGPTSVSTGVLNVRSNNALGTAAQGTTVTAGATLQLQGGFNYATAEPLSLAGAGFASSSFVAIQTGALVNVSGVNSYAGAISLTAAATISSDAGTLNLTGNTAIAGGAFLLTLGGEGNGSIGAGLGSTLTAGVTKTGAGAWVLTGASANTGLTTINAGTLQLGDGATGSWGASGPALTFTGGGRFNFQGLNAGSAQTLGTLTFAAGDGMVQSTFGTSGSTALTFTSLSRTAGATGNFIVSGGANGSTNKIVLSGQLANSFLNQGVFFGGDRYAWNDAGFVRGLNYTDPGATTSAGGTTLLTATHQQITGPITAQNTVTFTTLNIAGNHNITLNSAQAITVNGILKTGDFAGGATISGGAGVKAASGAELVIRTNGANDLLTINTPILANGASSLTKSGAGTLLLGMPNTYTGATNVDGGTLKLGSGGTLTTSSLAVQHGGALDLNGQTISNAVTINGPGAGGAATGALLNSNATTAASVGGITLGSSAIIGGAGDIASTAPLIGPTPITLIKVGAGTVTLGNNGGLGQASTRTSPTQIDAGVLKILASSSALGTSAARVILNGGTLHLASYNSVVAYPVTVTKDSAILSGVYTGSTGIIHSLGTLSIGSNKLTIAPASNIVGNTQVAFPLTVLSGDPVFDLQNTPNAVGYLAVGSVDDRGTPRTLTFQNSSSVNTQSLVSLNAGLTSVVEGTAVNILGSATSGGVHVVISGSLRPLGTFARLTVTGNSNFMLSTSAYQCASLAGDGLVYSGGTSVLTIGNANSTAPDTEFSGILSMLTVTKSGTTTLMLSGTATNSTTGVTSVNSGTLVLDKTGGANVFALTGTGLTIGVTGVFTEGNATVRYGAANQVPDTTALTMFAGATLDLNGFNQKFAGAVTMAGATIRGPGSLLTLNGAGTLTATGANLISTSLLGGGGTRTIATTGVSDSLTISGNIGNDATAITKTGSGTLILSGTNTYTGTTTISAGTLKLASATALYNGGSGALTLSAGTLDLAGHTLNTVSTLTATAGLITSTAPNGSLAAPSLGATNGASFDGTLSVNLTATGATSLTGSFLNTGHVTLNNTSALAFTVGSATTSLNNTGNVVFNANGTGSIAVASVNVNPAGTVTNGGSGSGTTSISGIIGSNVAGVIQNSVNSPLSLGGANLFTTGLKIVNGRVSATGATTPFGLGTVTLGDAATANTGATLDLGVAATYANPIAIVANASGGVLTIQNAGSFAATLSGPITAASSLTLQAGAGASLTVSGGIDDGPGSFAVTKAGAGAVTLAGVNAYDGATTVTGGTLQISGSLTATSDLNVNAGVVLLGASEAIYDGAALNLAGGTFRTGGFSEGNAAAAGVGLLRVNASSTIDFGVVGSSQLWFAGLGNHAAGTTLALANWSSGSDRLMFVGDDDARIAFQSSFAPVDISFNGALGFATQQIDSAHFEVIPEPSAGLLVLAALSFFGFRRVRDTTA